MFRTPRTEERGEWMHTRGNLTLIGQVRRMYPTANAMNPGDGAAMERFMQRREEWKRRGRPAIGIPLAVAVRLPTPRSLDWKGQTQKGQYASKDSICNYLGITGNQLNPNWVNRLMGFPDGWLDIPGKPPGMKASAPSRKTGRCERRSSPRSGTPSSRSRRRSSPAGSGRCTGGNRMNEEVRR